MRTLQSGFRLIEHSMVVTLLVLHVMLLLIKYISQNI